jgi:hypothetical protein
VKRLFSIVPFRRVALILTVLVLLFTGSTAVLVLGRHAAPALWAIPASLLAVVLVLVLPLLTLMARPYRLDIEGMLAETTAWAHWSYDEAQWRAANRLEVRRDLTSIRMPAVVLLGGGAALSLIGLIAGGSGAAGAGAFVMVAGLGIVSAMALASPGTFARIRSRGEIYLSPVGIYRRPGGYVPLFGLRQTLREVALVGGSSGPHLRFVCTIRQRRQGRIVTMTTEMARVLVPADRLEEAQQLVERFRSEELSG